VSADGVGGVQAPEPLPAHVVVTFSGGLDSTVLAWWLAGLGCRLTLLSIDYGQRHRKELESARAAAASLGAGHNIADLRGLSRLLGGSALTGERVAVPDGYYTDVSMRATVVPNRNALMLDAAVALAVTVRADAVAIGVHSGDHPIYPDCRPAFLDAYRETARLANEGFLPHGFQVAAPFIDVSKADIVALGAELRAPLSASWSCYRGRDRHCGTCGTCVERREAFAVAGVVDTTEYMPAEGTAR